MPSLRLPFALTALLTGVLTLAGCTAEPPIAAVPGAVAVVELFTSEGCSSCPSAEKVLNQLHTSALAPGGPPIIALAFHVDYWDRLGWTDRFASPDYSARQGVYTQTLPGGRFTRGRAYTPQMIVNGTTGFVGSARGKAREALTHSLATPAPAAIELTAVHRGDHLQITWSVDHDTPRTATTKLNLALTEDHLTSEIADGENSGRTLLHHAVVRGWHTQPLHGPSGTHRMPLPPDANPQHIAAVAYLQASPGGSILGASRAEPTGKR